MSQLPAMVYVLCGLTALACVALLVCTIATAQERITRYDIEIDIDTRPLPPREEADGE